VAKDVTNPELAEAVAPGVDPALQEIIITELLRRRPRRSPDHAAENRAFLAPQTVLQKLVDIAVELTGAGSAGISVLETNGDKELFRWRATAGEFFPFSQSTLPRDFSPCGVVLDQNAPQLMTEPFRFYPYIADLRPHVHEVLLVPFHHNGKAIGTIWVVSHTAAKHFDAEDERLVSSLSKFASIAVQVASNVDAMEASGRSLTAQLVERAQGERSRAALSSEVEHQARVFDTVLSSIADFAYTFDRSGRFTYVNKALLDLWGLPLEQAVGKNFFELKYPDDLAAKLQQQIQQVIETRRALSDETPYTSPSGVAGYYEYIFAPVFGTDGSVELVAGSTRDITARKQLEVDRERLLAALENQRLRLAAVIENAPAFICTLRGPEHVFELANERYYEMVGKRDLIGKPVRQAMPEVEGQGFFELLDKVYRSGETITGNEMSVLLSRTGNHTLDQRFMNFVYQPLREADGSVSGIFVHGVDVTEMVMARNRVQASEEQLRTSEERLAFSVQAAELGTFYCPMPLGRIEWNAKCKEHFWLPADAEVDFDQFYAILHPDDRERTRVAVEKAVFERASYDVEYRTVARDGRERWVRALGRGFYDEDGKPTRFDGVTMDITQRKLAEGRNRLLVAIDDGVRSLTNPDEITATCARLLGEHLAADRCAYADVEADEDTFNLTGNYNRGVPSIVGRYRFADFGAEVLQLMRDDKPYVVEDINTHQPPVADLTYYRQTMIRAVICVPLHKAGRFVGAMAVHQRTPRRWSNDEVEVVLAVAARCWESIERARVLRVLSTNEGRFRELADAMPQIVWAARPDGQLDYYNRRWFEYIKLPESAIDEASWDRFVHPEDLSVANDIWQAALRAGAPYGTEFRVRDAAGTYRWFLVRAMPIKDADGRVVRWFGTCTDVHDRKLLQEQNEKLLESERLARAEAEAASRAKDRFLAVLSHELRTPLTPVALTATAMEMDPRLPFDFREDVAMIRRNVELETRLIDDLLDLSRVTSGKLRLNLQPTNVHRLIRHVMETVGAELHEKQLKVQTELKAANDLVNADPARLQQALWNLLKNAAKFTPVGGSVSIRTRNDGDRVVIDVADTGKGIAADMMPHIFDPFEQGNADVTREYGGMGLGLAIVKAVVDLHGGTIRAASAGEGRGAVFTVELPLGQKRAAIASTADGGGKERGDTRKIRLLLVEDHADSAKILIRLLRFEGIDVEWAATVAAAVELASAQKFDLVVSDLGLPDGSGHDLMRRLSLAGPVAGIAMSGYGMEDDIRQSREAGFVEHLVKPVNLPQLREAIRRVVSGTRADG
jgi:PAS domain S-box-containing protein